MVQARTLSWLALLTEAHEEQASDAERRGDMEQAMGWFADAMCLRDVIQVVTSEAARATVRFQSLRICASGLNSKARAMSVPPVRSEGLDEINAAIRLSCHSDVASDGALRSLTHGLSVALQRQELAA